MDILLACMLSSWYLIDIKDHDWICYNSFSYSFIVTDVELFLTSGVISGTIMVPNSIIKCLFSWTFASFGQYQLKNSLLIWCFEGLFFSPPPNFYFFTGIRWFFSMTLFASVLTSWCVHWTGSQLCYLICFWGSSFHQTTQTLHSKALYSLVPNLISSLKSGCHFSTVYDSAI